MWRLFKIHKKSISQHSVLAKYHLTDFNQGFCNLETLTLFWDLTRKPGCDQSFERKDPILLEGSQIFQTEREREGEIPLERASNFNEHLGLLRGGHLASASYAATCQICIYVFGCNWWQRRSWTGTFLARQPRENPWPQIIYETHSVPGYSFISKETADLRLPVLFSEFHVPAEAWQLKPHRLSPHGPFLHIKQQLTNGQWVLCSHAWSAQNTERRDWRLAVVLTRDTPWCVLYSFTAVTWAINICRTCFSWQKLGIWEWI